MQLELYRDTRESILLATQQPNCLCVGLCGLQGIVAHCCCELVHGDSRQGVGVAGTFLKTP